MAVGDAPPSLSLGLLIQQVGRDRSVDDRGWGFSGRVQGCLLHMECVPPGNRSLKAPSLILTSEKGEGDLGGPGPQSSSVFCDWNRPSSLPGPQFPHLQQEAVGPSTDASEEPVDRGTENREILRTCGVKNRAQAPSVKPKALIM